MRNNLRAGDAGRAPNGRMGVQRFGAPEYDGSDKSIRIWSSKALKLTNHQVSNAFAARLVRKPDRLNAAAVVVLELLF